ncbi:MAG: hypothetical protein B7Z78_10140 [Rhodospirillales bacterium 20-60-12]|nr:MAG: hypothetical protein B7Z78_10140 [Rhodospirillales bacterium 20-60-12]
MTTPRALLRTWGTVCGSLIRPVPAEPHTTHRINTPRTSAGAVRWACRGKTGNQVNMPYWSIPADAFDNPDIMARWVELAFQAALRAGAITKPTRRRG